MFTSARVGVKVDFMISISTYGVSVTDKSMSQLMCNETQDQVNRNETITVNNHWKHRHNSLHMTSFWNDL